MTQKWFQIEKQTGIVVSIEYMSEEDAHKNCISGNSLRLADENVNPATQRWDFSSASWVSRTLPSRPEDDYRFMRQTGYPSAGEQLGALIKIVSMILSGEPVSSEAKAEFDVIVDRINLVKAEHPKPLTVLINA